MFVLYSLSIISSILDFQLFMKLKINPYIVFNNYQVMLNAIIKHKIIYSYLK